MERIVCASGQSSTSSPCQAKLRSQPALIYEGSTYVYTYFFLLCSHCHIEKVIFTQSGKIHALNLEELKMWVMPNFPCLKFPSNGVIPSLSFPFYLRVGERYFMVEGGGAADMSKSLGRAAKYQAAILLCGRSSPSGCLDWILNEWTSEYIELSI